MGIGQSLTPLVFHNQEAISVAMHRGLIEDIQHEALAYTRLEIREKKQQERLSK